MLKPCRLELNNSGAWKLLGKFDAAEGDYADDVLTSAGNLVDALNLCPGAPGGATLRVSTDEPQPDVLMQYESREKGWRDARTGEPA